jgi:hypothetical protein
MKLNYKNVYAVKYKKQNTTDYDNPIVHVVASSPVEAINLIKRQYNAVFDSDIIDVVSKGQVLVNLPEPQGAFGGK